MDRSFSPRLLSWIYIARQILMIVMFGLSATLLAGAIYFSSRQWWISTKDEAAVLAAASLVSFLAGYWLRRSEDSFGAGYTT